MEENMRRLTISLPEDRMSKLKEMASGLGTTPEELVRASVEDLLGRPKEFPNAPTESNEAKRTANGVRTGSGHGNMLEFISNARGESLL
jgi:hypothetical protein